MYNFLEILSDSVKTGHVFVISGYASQSAQELTILLSTGAAQDSNAALSIVSKFADRKIVRSAFINGNAVSQEEDNNDIANLSCENPMPLRAGQQFTFCILVGDDRFHIALNDVPYCTYKYQILPNQIRSLMVFGDIDSLVKVNHLQAFPFSYPNIRSDYEDLAFEGFIPREYKPGSLITISGIVNGKSDGEFIIMFNEDETSRQLIHLNVRFDEQAVVMNTMTSDEGWGENEIRSNEFPFEVGQEFKIAIAFTDTEVKVAVNGSSLMKFSFSFIESESLWSSLTGFRVKNGVDMIVNINGVEHTQMGDRDCDDFESYSAL